MKIVQLSAEQFHSITDQQNMDISTLIAETIRSELWARTTTTRRALCLRVMELLMHSSVQSDSIRNLLAELERNGEILDGENGQIAIAPLRAVELSEQKYLLIGGPDTKHLESILSSRIEMRGITRKTTYIERSRIELLLKEIGGIILTPERWSRLERAAKADKQWILQLDSELAANCKDSGSLETKCDRWQPYRPDDTLEQRHSRWRNSKPDVTGKLWRAKHTNGYWIYVWTDGKAPDQGKHIRLRMNDATRTRFALDVDAGNPHIFFLEGSGELFKLELAVPVPQEEYRYLQTIGNTTEKSTVFEIPAEEIPRVHSLFERLGIVLVNRSEQL